MSDCAGLAQSGQEAILPSHLGLDDGLGDLLEEQDGSDGDDERRRRFSADLSVTMTSAPEDILFICLVTTMAVVTVMMMAGGRKPRLVSL